MTRKNQNNILLGLGIVSIGYLLFNQGAKVVDNILSKVSMIYRGFSASIEWADFEVVFFIEYSLKNDNDLSVNNVSFSGTVSYEGVNIGRVQTVVPVSLAPLTRTNSQTLELRVGLSSLPSVIKDLILQGSFSNSIIINGIISNGVVSLPTGNQTIPLFTLPSGLKAVQFVGMPMLKAA